nr:uncharacterized mitochondrial protein AtMg00810-like [Tanacetum cinerariifolium]
MVEQAKLKLDLVGKPVDHTDYRSMIRSLMCVTSSRPDIMFVTCMCARYQANPNEHHVSAVKRIFRYLIGTINLGLWYPKDFGFNLTAYSDADHAGCHLDRKSTSGSVQFLGDKLVCWSSKKQNCVSISIAESEYVTVSSCCAQLLWMHTQLTDYGFFYDKVPIYCDLKSAIAISCNLWELILPVGTLNLAVGMPCAFYSQHARLRLVNTARPNLAVVNAVKGGANSGRITGKGTLKTSKLDFEDVYFVKELKFNLLSVSQMCYKKNSVLFIDIGCFVLSLNFKLTDESQVLLKVPRRNNTYNVDIKNIVPKESLTCLVAKATLDESMLWHRRLGHINFKNINKLVKAKLVRASKNETTGILKKFITEIENLVDKKVKVIKCENRTEFKNSVMNDFYAIKGIRKEFNVARTPQQNGVAKRRNRTLIKAARTMELVVKPYSKTLYELFRGRTPALSFMRPFACHVTILNTLDHLGKFDGKAGAGPKWLFDIDMLTKSMNCVPVIAGTNSNDFTGTKDSIIESQSNMETGSTQDYIYMPLWKDGSSLFDSSPKLSDDAESPSSDDPKMPSLETIATNDDSKEDADFSNLESSIHVSPTPTTITHKNHPLKKVIGSLNTPVQTRSKLKPTNEQRFINVVYKGKAHKDLNTCLFAYFLSQIEPIRVAKALTDPAWGKKAIGTKWVFKNKKDDRGIVIKNKARLVVQGYTQEEGIDYDEVFVPVAKIKAIRMLLAYTSFMLFMIYQMNVKSDFLYERIEEEVYVCQPPGFEDPDHPDKVYKVVKALYGLHQAPRSCQDKYVTEVLRKFNFSDVRSANTLVDMEKTLVKDADGDDVDMHLYKSMIRSLMYLTASRPDIMYAVCVCARFQVTPKVSHLHAVKRIFRYLKGHPKLGLWYLKDSPFELVVYANSDYAGASLDRKSTTGVVSS